MLAHCLLMILRRSFSLWLPAFSPSSLFFPFPLPSLPAGAGFRPLLSQVCILLFCPLFLLFLYDYSTLVMSFLQAFQGSQPRLRTLAAALKSNEAGLRCCLEEVLLHFLKYFGGLVVLLRGVSFPGATAGIVPQHPCRRTQRCGGIGATGKVSWVGK